jgi:septum site-determining protein MinC
MPKNPSVFQLKADFLPITVLQIKDCNAHALQLQLETITSTAPHYFANAPVLVDFSHVKDQEQHHVESVCAVLKAHQMQPIAVRGTNYTLTIPVIADRRDQKIIDNTDKKVAETVIVDKPVRAGTQIYAKDADLIVLAPVNAGAEIIADGNIHAYGPLRGRVLAGASGNTEVRIFCHTLEAELIAIAGVYLVAEQITTPKNTTSMLQIQLKQDGLHIASIG